MNDEPILPLYVDHEARLKALEERPTPMSIDRYLDCEGRIYSNITDLEFAIDQLTERLKVLEEKPTYAGTTATMKTLDQLTERVGRLEETVAKERTRTNAQHNLIARLYRDQPQPAEEEEYRAITDEERRELRLAETKLKLQSLPGMDVEKLPSILRLGAGHETSLATQIMRAAADQIEALQSKLEEANQARDTLIRRNQEARGLLEDVQAEATQFYNLSTIMKIRDYLNRTGGDADAGERCDSPDVTEAGECTCDPHGHTVSFGEIVEVGGPDPNPNCPQHGTPGQGETE